MEWEGSKVLVLGLGQTGLSAIRWLEGRGAQVRAADTRAAPPGLAALQHTAMLRVTSELPVALDRTLVMAATAVLLLLGYFRLLPRPIRQRWPRRGCRRSRRASGLTFSSTA